ncbi:MAG TPA: DNA polymerase III subunit chi [Alphaproteobacteria bacterium]|nr:DNA polymerase III subunit chi [Alphaproteobacteria bacterium]
MEARFYQVGGQLPADVDAVLPGLLDKITSTGKRVLLIVADTAVARLDERLWPAGSAFLPHGKMGEGDEDRQPILLAGVGQAAGQVGERLPVITAGAEEAFEIPAESIVYLYHAAVADNAARRLAGLQEKGWRVSLFEQTAQGWRKQSI